MSQSKRGSMVETLTSTGTGYLVSLVILHVIHPSDSLVQDAGIVTIFTVASVLRGYIIRRIFNKGTV